MKNGLPKLVLLLLLLFTGCESNNCCDPEVDNLEATSWLLIERGYSPGSGYIVEPVSEDPPQIMKLHKDGGFYSNIRGLEDYQFYQILNDVNTEVLSLYESEPHLGDQSVDQLEHSYTMDRDGDTVKLYYRFCIEGCHLTLRRLE